MPQYGRHIRRTSRFQRPLTRVDVSLQVRDMIFEDRQAHLPEAKKPTEKTKQKTARTNQGFNQTCSNLAEAGQGSYHLSRVSAFAPEAIK